MSSVDDRIVNMQFNNTQFQSGSAASTKSLETLEKTITGMGSSTGMTKMGSSVDGIKAKFSALQVAGVTALATIVNKAVTAGLALLKSFTIDPILAGFHEYETNLNSIQTIMANTGKSVKIVNSYLAQLNHYSDQTIYSFSQMAEAIGKFTSAGVGLDQATSAIKGMANTAALSGSNVQQLNTAMYQMSQALSTGTIRLMDWNSLANAGMGGENIREALMATNRTLGDNGKAMDEAIKSAGSFRDSLAAGWLSAQTFTKTMTVMAGNTLKSGKTVAFTVEQLKKMGYADDAAKSLNKLSQASIDSATKVKTFTQLIDVVKESIGSGWAKIFQDLFGNFTEATKMWTGVSQNITGVVGDIFNNVDKMLQGWRKLGGYQDLWTGFGNIFKTIGNLVRPFVDAFKAMLPATATAGSGLAKVTSAFANITGWMEKVSRGAAVLTPVLVAIFSIFKDVGAVIGAVVRGLQPLFALLGQLATVAGGALSKGAEIGNNLVQGILQGLNPTAIEAAITEFANNIVAWIKGALGIHSPAAELVPVGIAIVQGIAQGISATIGFVVRAMGALIGAIFDGIGNLFSGMDALDITALMNAVLTGGILLAVRSFTKSLTGLVGGITSALENVTAPFQQLTSTLKTMQTAIRAKIILDIAIAVALLAASIVALSLLNPKQIAIGLGALSTLLAELVGALGVLSKIKPEGLASMSVAIALISGSMLVLSGVIAILGNLDMTTLAKGLGALAIALGIMVGALNLMAGLGPRLPAAAAAIYIMANAMVVMSAAVFALGSMDFKTLAKGLGAIAIGLGLFVGALAVLSSLGPTVGVGAGGILIMATAMVVLAGAVAAFGSMKISTLAKGLGSVAIGLGLFVGALAILAAMGPLAGAGAGAILLMATAMAVLAVAVGTLGRMKVSTLAKGLGAIAIALALFLLAAAGAEVVALGLEVLGTSLFLIGAGMALAGVGMLAFASGLALLTTVGVAAIGIIILAINAFLALLPTFALQLASAFVVFIQTIAAASPKLREAFGEIFKNFIGTIRDAIPQITALVNDLIGAIFKVVTTNIPKYGKLISTLITTGLNVIKKAIPEMTNAGADIITGVLQGLAERIPQMLNAAGDVIAAFIRGLGAQASKIATAAAQLLLDLLHGIRDAVDDAYIAKVAKAVAEIGEAIITGIIAGLDDFAHYIWDKIQEIAEEAWDHARTAFKVPGAPSRLFYPIGESVAMGIAAGISDRTSDAVGAIVGLAKAVFAAGDDAIERAEKASRKKRHRALVMQARADVAAEIAKDAEKEARQHPKNKALQKAANAARRAADDAQKAANRAQHDAADANKHVRRLERFQRADAEGRGDILTAQSKSLAQRARETLARANAEARAARDLTGQARKDMLKAAREDARAAKRLEEQSRKAKEKADEYYGKSIKQRIAAITKERRLEEQRQRRQDEFDALSTEEQSKVLEKRAKKHQRESDRAQKQADDLLQQAKRLAEKNPQRAERLLKRAERKAREAERAAQRAQDESERAQQLAEEADTGTDGTTNPALAISHTALEDAAKAMDRYTESLQEAEAAAQAGRDVPQFVQNNYSPEALSASEIYRGTKNLLTAQEIKMGAPD